MSTVNKMFRRARSCRKGVHFWYNPDGRQLGRWQEHVQNQGSLSTDFEDLNCRKTEQGTLVSLSNKVRQDHSFSKHTEHLRCVKCFRLWA